jgi:hypothetical protein
MATTEVPAVTPAILTPGMKPTPPNTSRRRRLSRTLGAIISNTAYLAGLWLLGIAGMIGALALLALLLNAGAL